MGKAKIGGRKYFHSVKPRRWGIRRGDGDAKDMEVDKGKHSIIPPSPQKSFLDRASNRLSGTGHWLCAPYLKRVRMNRDDEISGKAAGAAGSGCLVGTEGDLGSAR
jgi:hypothetical protein